MGIGCVKCEAYLIDRDFEPVGFCALTGLTACLRICTRLLARSATKRRQTNESRSMAQVSEINGICNIDADRDCLPQTCGLGKSGTHARAGGDEGGTVAEALA